MNSIKLTQRLFLVMFCTLLTNGCSSHSGSEDSFSVTPPQNSNGANPEIIFKLTCVEAQFVELLNLYRKSQGLNALDVSKSAVLAARWHAQDMATKNYFSHTEPTGRTFSTRTLSFGYQARSENIAAGSSSAAATFCQWRNSSGHNTNMLNVNHKSTGVGFYTGSGNYNSYWSSCFGFVAQDQITEPLTADQTCEMPVDIPSC